MNLTKTSLTLALTTALGASGLAVADGNPFSMQSLSHGYMVAEASMPGGEGKAAEGKCGGSKAPAKSAEGKCGEAKCGASKDTEGKCGAKKQPAKSAEGKCGEAKCGASKGK